MSYKKLFNEKLRSFDDMPGFPRALNHLVDEMRNPCPDTKSNLSIELAEIPAPGWIVAAKCTRGI